MCRKLTNCAVFISCPATSPPSCPPVAVQLTCPLHANSNCRTCVVRTISSIALGNRASKVLLSPTKLNDKFPRFATLQSQSLSCVKWVHPLKKGFLFNLTTPFLTKRLEKLYDFAGTIYAAWVNPYVEAAPECSSQTEQIAMRAVDSRVRLAARQTLVLRLEVGDCMGEASLTGRLGLTARLTWSARHVRVNRTQSCNVHEPRRLVFFYRDWLTDWGERGGVGGKFPSNPCVRKFPSNTLAYKETSLQGPEVDSDDKSLVVHQFTLRLVQHAPWRAERRANDVGQQQTVANRIRVRGRIQPWWDWSCSASWRMRHTLVHWHIVFGCIAIGHCISLRGRKGCPKHGQSHRGWILPRIWGKFGIHTDLNTLTNFHVICLCACQIFPGTPSEKGKESRLSACCVWQVRVYEMVSVQVLIVCMLLQGHLSARNQRYRLTTRRYLKARIGIMIVEFRSNSHSVASIPCRKVDLTGTVVDAWANDTNFQIPPRIWSELFYKCTKLRSMMTTRTFIPTLSSGFTRTHAHTPKISQTQTDAHAQHTHAHTHIRGWNHFWVLLCADRVPVVPVLTTAALRGTAVLGSLGTPKLPQRSKTQAYASNVYSNLSKAKQLSTDAGCCGCGFL